MQHDSSLIRSFAWYSMLFVPGISLFCSNISICSVQYKFKVSDFLVHSVHIKQIGMIDDHDECEWVNVSSGTGSPGLSRTNSTEP